MTPPTTASPHTSALIDYELKRLVAHHADASRAAADLAGATSDLHKKAACSAQAIAHLAAATATLIQAMAEEQ